MTQTDKRPKNRINTETHILKIVDFLVANEGAKAVTMSRVVKEAGVARTLLYRYFNNLDGLLLAYGMSRNLWPEIGEIIGLSVDEFIELDRSEKLEKILSGWSFALRQRPQTLAILAWSLSEKNALTDLMETQLNLLGKKCRSLLREGREPIEESDTLYDFDATWVIISAAKTFLELRGQTQQRFGGMSIQTKKNKQRINDGFDYIFKAISYYQNRPY
jgi:AcrR family transcriptional regulator